MREILLTVVCLEAYVKRNTLDSKIKLHNYIRESQTISVYLGMPLIFIDFQKPTLKPLQFLKFVDIRAILKYTRKILK